MLGARYRLGHIAGAVLCVLGPAILIVADGSWGQQGDMYPHAATGDGLVLMGAVLYSLCNVMQESLLGSNLPISVCHNFGRILEVTPSECSPYHHTRGIRADGAVGDTAVTWWLLMIGVWGTLWSTLQAALLERSRLFATTFTIQVWHRLAIILLFQMMSFYIEYNRHTAKCIDDQ